MNTRAIVFDFDGVLVESVDIKTSAFAEMYCAYGEEVVKEVTKYHLENGGISRYKKFQYFHEKILGIALSADIEKKMGDDFSALVEAKVISSNWVEGAKDFLESHYLTLPLYVASGTPHDELIRIIELRSMSKYFRACQGSPITKEYFLNQVISENKTTNLLMVGDAITDFEAAMDAGIRFIGRVDKNKINPFPSNIQVIENLYSLHQYL
jgi:phosphoglycolate phosphatase-like HAD superfamily hydrolase